MNYRLWLDHRFRRGYDLTRTGGKFITAIEGHMVAELVGAVLAIEILQVAESPAAVAEVEAAHFGGVAVAMGKRRAVGRDVVAGAKVAFEVAAGDDDLGVCRAGGAAQAQARKE